MPQAKQYREVERKYVISDDDLPYVPIGLAEAPITHIEQYYINGPNEPYELRFRRTTNDGSIQVKATLKSGLPPDRLEVETELDASQFESWQASATTEIIAKKRQ